MGRSHPPSAPTKKMHASVFWEHCGRCLDGLYHPHRTWLRVCSADTRSDTRSDQRRRHPPADR
jgi:hypothetical protein